MTVQDALQKSATFILDHLRGFPRLIALTLGLFLLIYLIERAYGEAPKKYLSRTFFHDLVYWFYYRSGVHNLLLTAAVLQILSPAFGFLNLNLLAGWPVVARYFTYWIIYDFTAYWVHRWKHSNPWLWAFHSVHHSQETLSFTTITRGHPLEQLLGSVIAFFPTTILGAPPGAWLPFQLLREFLEAIQHSSIPWRMG